MNRQELCALAAPWDPELRSGDGASGRSGWLAYCAGRLCAERAMQLLGKPPALVGRGARNEPCWPVGLIGSIAHSADYAYAAVADACDLAGIGIDTEHWLSDEEMADVRCICCTPAESLALFNVAAGGGHPRSSKQDPRQDHERDRKTATLVFSVKESLYKAVYRSVERFVDFDEVEIASIDWDTQHVSCRVLSADLPNADRLRARFSYDTRRIYTVVTMSYPE